MSKITFKEGLQIAKVVGKGLIVVLAIKGFSEFRLDGIEFVDELKGPRPQSDQVAKPTQLIPTEFSLTLEPYPTITPHPTLQSIQPQSSTTLPTPGTWTQITGPGRLQIDSNGYLDLGYIDCRYFQDTDSRDFKLKAVYVPNGRCVIWDPENNPGILTIPEIFVKKGEGIFGVDSIDAMVSLMIITSEGGLLDSDPYIRRGESSLIVKDLYNFFNDDTAYKHPWYKLYLPNEYKPKEQRTQSLKQPSHSLRTVGRLPSDSSIYAYREIDTVRHVRAGGRYYI